METERRRSRMRRARRGKKLEISSRDLEIFQLLCRYRYLSSTYIHAFVGGASETRLKERLGDLFHEGYLDRPARQWEFAGCRHRPAIYEIGSGGLKNLRLGTPGDLEPRTWLGAHPHLQFLHSLMICEVLASVELDTRSSTHLRFIPWAEIAARAPSAARTGLAPFRFVASVSEPITVIPDALFGIEYRVNERRSYRFFALEADRNTMPVVRSRCAAQSSYHRKLVGYRAVLAAGLQAKQLGVPNLIVLTVTTSERRKQTIMKQLGSQVDSASSCFLFKSTADQSVGSAAALKNSYLNEPWERAGHPPINIAEP